MKVATIFLKYDYGIMSRGESLEKKVFLPAIQQNVDTVVPFWLEEQGYPSNITELQQNLISFIKDKRPDIAFFIFFQDEIKIATLDIIRNYCITINWFCDDQWRFDSFTKVVAPHLSYSITTDKYSLDKYKDIHVNALLSQWGTECIVSEEQIINASYDYEVSFVGGKNITREWMISEVRAAGYTVECFGSGWDNGRVTYDEMNSIFLHSKINLNLSNSISKDIRFYFYMLKSLFFFEFVDFRRYLKKVKQIINILFSKKNGKKDVEQIKARYFEISGSGGFQISQYCLGIEDYYKIGSEIAVFSTIDELIKQVAYFLRCENIRKNITLSSNKRTLEYTYNKRIKEVLQFINKSENINAN